MSVVVVWTRFLLLKYREIFSRRRCLDCPVVGGIGFGPEPLWSARKE